MPVILKYFLSKARYCTRRWLADLTIGPEHVIIYQPGKVGSKTVLNTLEHHPGLGPNREVLHFHYLSKQKTDEFEAKYIHAGNRGLNDLPTQAWDAILLRRGLRSSLVPCKAKFITLTRDPVARNISDFFKRIEFVPTLGSRDFRVRSKKFDFELSGDNVVEDLIRIFIDRYDHSMVLNYYRDEFLPVVGIDILKAPFDPAAGYAISTHGKVDILTMRLEDLDRVLPTALESFLGLPRAAVLSVNQTRLRRQGVLYEKFKTSIRLDTAMLDLYYRSDYARHFYSASELHAFRQRWGHTLAQQQAPG